MPVVTVDPPRGPVTAPGGCPLGDCGARWCPTCGNGGHPRRIRLSRKAGWRKPSCAIVVARPSRWGNPYKVEQADHEIYVVHHTPSDYRLGRFHTKAEATKHAVDCFAEDLDQGGLAVSPDEVFWALSGYDLACWCPLDEPCHADVLLEFANREVRHDDR